MNNSLNLLEPNLLLEAIESYDYYTPSQREILKIIVQTDRKSTRLNSSH